MATVKDRIQVHNTYTVRFASIEDSESAFSKAAINPASAYAELWSVSTQQFIALGSLGPNSVGSAATIEDNIITFTVPKTATTVFGDYKLFVTAVYADGEEVTEMVPFKIMARS